MYTTVLFQRFIVSIVFAFVFVCCFASIAQAVDVGNYGGKPGNPGEGNDHTKQWFIYKALPVGEKREDVLLVSNDSDTSMTLKLYPADSAKSSDGGFALEQEVEERDEVGSWITLSASEVTLEPHSTQEVPFTIEIPADTRVDAGEHAGGILVQEKKEAVNSAVGGIQLSTRIGVRVYVTVPGKVIEGIRIESFSLQTAENGTFIDKEAVIEIENTGTIREDVVIITKVESVYPWLATLFDRARTLPIVNERGMQVLRDDTLRSSLQFISPTVAFLRASATVVYTDSKGVKQSIEAPVVEQWVLPPNKQLAFIGGVACVALIAFGLIVWGVIRMVIRLRRALRLLESQEAQTTESSDDSEELVVSPQKQPKKNRTKKPTVKKSAPKQKRRSTSRSKKTTESSPQ